MSIEHKHMMIAHKIRLKPNNVQATYFAKASGVARFSYNWALAEWTRQYEAWKLDNTLEKPSHFSLCRLLNSIKKEQFPWMMEVTKCAPEMSIHQLGTSFKNFFSGHARYPKFRKKGVHDRFTISNSTFKIEGKRVRIPKLGWVRMYEPLRFTGKIMNGTISRVADRWFISVTVETNDLPRKKSKNQGVVGVDLGVKNLATLSTGEKIPGPKPHKALLSRLRRLSKNLSRKKAGSSNRLKAKIKLARLHERIANIRKDSLHQLTSRLTQQFEAVAIENLNVSGMVKNRHLARSISDMGFFELKRQLGYKSELTGCKVFIADTWFPSSKTCSNCSHKLENLSLSTREWKCPSCGSVHDRDVNAAINLKNLAIGYMVSVYGEESSGLKSNSSETILCEVES